MTIEEILHKVNDIMFIEYQMAETERKILSAKTLDLTIATEGQILTPKDQMNNLFAIWESLGVKQRKIEEQLEVVPESLLLSAYAIMLQNRDNPHQNSLLNYMARLIDKINRIKAKER